MNTRSYSSKLLLFGEHTVIKGSQALAIPQPLFSGSWVFEEDNKEREYRETLLALVSYLEHAVLDGSLDFDINVGLFRQKLSEGLYFHSSIPVGYGVGSSGALCAAIYDAFVEKKEVQRLGVIKRHLAQIENFFHGASSGFDPLVCYLNEAVLVESKEEMKLVKAPQQLKGEEVIFVFDTKIPRKTAPFVQIFLEKCKDKYYLDRCEAELIPLVEEGIQAFLEGNGTLLFENIHEIGYFQFRFFEEMIPNDFKTVWLNGLSSDLYKLKLCGAGGGGFLLGITKDFKRVQSVLGNDAVKKVFG